MAESRAEIGELWRQIHRETHDLFRAAFRDTDINPGNMMMLRQIQVQPGVTVSELARRTGIVKSHVSKVIDGLCQQGYLEKRPDPDDQRLLHVYPTSRGLELANDVAARGTAAWSRVFEEVPETEQVELVRGLQVLLTALRKSNSTLSDRR